VPLGPASRWAATSNVKRLTPLTAEGRDGGREGSEGQSQRGGEERRSETEEEAQGPLASERGLYLDICGGAPEFLVTPLLMGPVCLHLARAGLKSQSAPREPTAEGLLEQKGLQLMPESVDE